MSEANADAILEATTAAIQRLFRPLAAAMIRAGMTFPMFNRLARVIFVEAALEDFAVEGEPPSHSRISILSGVHRQEIRRLMMGDRIISDPPLILSLSAKVIAVWTSEPAYLDADQRPLSLPLTAAGDKPSFERLVSTISKDVRPRALLDEWLHQEVVEMRGDLVRLRRRAFLPTDGFAEKAYFFGRNLRDHIASGAHNLAGKKPAFFDRAVYYDRLRPESIEELHALATEKAMELLIEINHRASQLAAHDRKDGDGGYRFTLGAFFYGEPTGTLTPADHADKDRADVKGTSA